MNNTIKILDNDRIFFQNRIYSKILLYDNSGKKLNDAKILYVHPESNTYVDRPSLGKGYVDSILYSDVLRHNLLEMKDVINDQRIPPSVVRHICEEHWYGEENADVFEYEEYFGRDWIINQIRELHVTSALPEVARVVLEDPSPILKAIAISTIISLGGEIAAKTLCEKLDDKNELIDIREAAAIGLQKFPYKNTISSLKNTFEETAYTTPEDLYSHWRETSEEYWNINKPDYELNHTISQKLRQREWMPLICLESLGNIPSMESLRTLEKAAKMPSISVFNYQEDSVAISDYARNCISNWIVENVNILNDIIERNGKLNQLEIERSAEIKRLIYTYDLEEKREVYNTPFGRVFKNNNNPKKLAFSFLEK